VRDLALDPTTGDLALDPATKRLALTSGVEAKAQRLRLRLALWRGEYVLNTDAGVPYTDRLGQKGPAARALLEADLRRAAATSPGIATLESFALVVDPATRVATVALSARADTGEPVRLDAFQVGT
jgi:hypothetical protein